MQVIVEGKFISRSGIDLQLLQGSPMGDRPVKLFCPEDRVLPAYTLGQSVRIDGLVLQNEGKRFYCMVLNDHDDPQTQPQRKRSAK